jgi:hypothetical protein
VELQCAGKRGSEGFLLLEDLLCEAVMVDRVLEKALGAQLRGLFKGLQSGSIRRENSAIVWTKLPSNRAIESSVAMVGKALPEPLWRPQAPRHDSRNLRAGGSTMQTVCRQGVWQTPT